jgi:hypothetical protein
MLSEWSSFFFEFAFLLRNICIAHGKDPSLLSALQYSRPASACNDDER